MVDRFSMSIVQAHSPCARLACQADKALASGDSDQCIALIEKIYDLMDREYRAEQLAH